MADEGGLAVLLQHLVEAIIPEVVGQVLEVQQDGHLVGGCQFVQLLALGGVRLHPELLLADDDRPALQVFLDGGHGIGFISDFIGSKEELFWVSKCDALGVLGEATLACQPIGFPVMSARLGKISPRRQQDRGRDTHGPLMGDEVFIGPAVVVRVLMNVDYWLHQGIGGSSEDMLAREGHEQGGSEKAAAFHAGTYGRSYPGFQDATKISPAYDTRVPSAC